MEDGNKLELTTKAAFGYALTVPEWSTTGKAHAATSHPWMLGTKVIVEESKNDTALKELKQLVEPDAED